MVICTLEPVLGSSENLLIPLFANYGGYVSNDIDPIVKNQFR